MKYITIFLSLLAVTSCSEDYPKESEIETSIDSIIVDTVKVAVPEVDSRTEVIDTLKKKNVKNRYTSKCVAYRSWRIS